MSKKLKKAYFTQNHLKGKMFKEFWNYCKPYFTNNINNTCNDKNVILIQNEQILQNDSKTSKTFNNYFLTITDEFGNFD